MITITSKQDNFRRCGVAHRQTPTDYPDDYFSAIELDILQKEPMLVVVATAEKDPKSSKGKAGKGNPPAASAPGGAKGVNGKPPAGTESGDPGADGASA